MNWGGSTPSGFKALGPLIFLGKHTHRGKLTHQAKSTACDGRVILPTVMAVLLVTGVSPQGLDKGLKSELRFEILSPWLLLTL